MHSNSHRVRIRSLVTTTIVTAILIWGITSLTNDDPLWFYQKFDARAERFVIYWDGTIQTIDRDHTSYDTLMTTFADAIAHPAGYEGNVVLTEKSIADYKTRYRMLEVVFPEPVQVHTRHPIPDAEIYLVPLNENHGTNHRAFAFPGRLPHTLGPLILDSSRFESLYGTIESAISVAAIDQ